jgi:hypothetical protein
MGKPRGHNVFGVFCFEWVPGTGLEPYCCLGKSFFSYFHTMAKNILVILFQVISVLALAQSSIPPLLKNDFKKVTSYNELSAYINLLEKQSELLKVEVIGHSVKGRNLYAMKFSTSVLGQDTSKIKVLIFAQQHGNEQSGKEGALLLALELLKPENRYLFDNIDLVLVPQVNPDGSEVNRRVNANDVDLNRNHLILTEPETIALHRLFDSYLFEVTMDLHEYSPYSGEWKKYGYRKNSDITLGSTTNPSVAQSIRNLSDNEYLPYIFNYLNARCFSSSTYCPGGPPEVEYIRHSTFDINDGRQGFGILNTFSFIQEGMNGRDDSIDNIQHRAEGQMTGMRGLLQYIHGNKDKVKTLVLKERNKLLLPDPGTEISIQAVHVANGQPLLMHLLSYYSGQDTAVTVKDYRPVVKSVYDVLKPLGYMIPETCVPLMEWVCRQALETEPAKTKPGEKIMQYVITGTDSIDFEGDIIADPKVSLYEVKELPRDTGFIFIPVAQLKGNMAVIALEPKSMLGLVTYGKFADLLQVGKSYPVLRVVDYRK